MTSALTQIIVQYISHKRHKGSRGPGREGGGGQSPVGWIIRLRGCTYSSWALHNRSAGRRTSGGSVVRCLVGDGYEKEEENTPDQFYYSR